MNRFNKFLLILLSISIVLFLFFINYFSNPKEDNSLESQNESNFQNAMETNKSGNDGGVNVEEALKFDESDDTNFSQDGWELVWRDEFEHNYLDPGKWNIENWASMKNNELQYYTPGNVKVEDGFLKLISKREKYKGRDYTSGAIHTKGKFDFLYGKAEMRAKLPPGQGMLPAFWMMTDNEDTWLPEIDIMEMLGHQPNQVWMVSHWLGNDGTLKSVSNSFQGPDYSTDFHTFGIEWTTDSIKWFIDDVERFSTSVIIPSEKMYLYLNTAVGGDWPGSPDHNTVFPVNFEVDYVRVFKKK
jgi:beta-glucanase (GH16 family)